MTLANIVKLGLIIWKTSIRAQKIDTWALKTYGMSSASFCFKTA